MAIIKEVHVDDDDVVNYYKEKKWGKTEGGEYLIDGYTFKGKRPLDKVLIEIKTILKRGVENQVGNIKFKALDVRESGTALEIPLQVEEADGTGRGIAMVKLYEPSSKKKMNNIMVSKHKDYGIQFVVVVAERVIKPLIKSILFDEKKFPTSVNTCTICGKICSTPGGLKGHFTKMHKDNNKNSESKECDESESKECETERLLNESVVTIENSESIEESLKNEINLSNESVKRYENDCKNCGLRFEAERKYTIIQQKTKHSCTKTRKQRKCEKCEVFVENNTNLKKHMRDKHNVLSCSMSPPPKKSKLQPEDEVPMDILESKEIMDELSTSIEEMDIDINNEEDEYMKRSQQWDEKIRKKEDKLKEDEKAYKRKLNESEHKIKEEKQKSAKKLKQLKRKKSKSEKMKTKKEPNEDITGEKVSSLKPVPEKYAHLVDEGDLIYEVPGDGACAPSCAAAFLFQDEKFGYQLRKNMNQFQAKHWEKRYKHITPCSPETPFQRHLKGGEVLFTNPEKLLKFLKNSEEGGYMWSDSEDLTIIADMYQISIKVITVKRKNDQNPTVNWIHPEKEMSKYAEIPNIGLKEMTLWHEDEVHYSLIVSKNSILATIGSLTQRLNIASFKDTITEVKDDKKELKRSQERIKVLEKEYQFCEKELRSKTEEAEKLKSEVKDLRQMLTLLEQQGDIENTQEEETQQDDISEEEFLFKMKSSGFKRNNPQNQPLGKKSVKELKCKTCEYKVQSQAQLRTHTLSTHVSVKESNCTNGDSTSKQKEQLNIHVQSEHVSEKRVECTECDIIFKTEDQLKVHNFKEHIGTRDFKCGKCNQVFNTQGDFQTHDLSEHESGKEFKCNKCRYTVHTQAQLNTHLRLKHPEERDNTNVKKDLAEEDQFNCTECAYQGTSKNELENHIKITHRLTCRTCGEDFRSKPDLMTHRKLKHKNAVAPCRKNIIGNCPFSPDRCWWNHTEESETSIECYFCELTFATKNEVMLHRKKEHAKTVKTCKKELESTCPFNDTNCWFKHQNKSTNSVFQEAPEDPEPPLKI